MRIVLLTLLIILPLMPACVSSFSPGHHPRPIEMTGDDEEKAKGDDAPTKEGRRSVLVEILLYLPNRVLDVFDLARFGVDLGPGLGGQLKATEPLQLAAVFRFSAGIGFQGLRHLPVQVSAEAGARVGPADVVADPGLVWYESPTDLRVFLHLFLVGGHVAVDPLEWLDLAAGFVFLDPANDDL